MTEQITQDELFNLFGENMPVEVAAIILSASNTDSVAEVRAKVEAFAAANMSEGGKT
jgi:hypothetical protein